MSWEANWWTVLTGLAGLVLIYSAVRQLIMGTVLKALQSDVYSMQHQHKEVCRTLQAALLEEQQRSNGYKEELAETTDCCAYAIAQCKQAQQTVRDLRAQLKALQPTNSSYDEASGD